VFFHIIITIGKTALFGTLATRRGFCQIATGFTSLVFFFTEQGRQPCVQPKPGGKGLLAFMSSSDKILDKSGIF
jgi:hypothetical protein